MKNKKTVLAIIGIIAIVLVTIGITYAYWLVTKTQTGNNVITAGCLDITLNGEANDINLTNQFPISDEEGMELVPYEFTVTNNCNTAVDYYINLESIGTENRAINADSLKVALDDNISILGDDYSGEPTISGAYASHRLGFGTLQASNGDNTNDSVTYKLRLWIDADAPISEMNKTYIGKVSVTVGQGVNNPLKESTLAYDIVSKYDGVDKIETISTKWYETIPSDFTPSPIATNSYYWGTEYDFDSKTGYYKLSGNIVQKTVAECRATEGLCGKYTIFDTENTETTSSFLFIVSSFTNSSKEDNSYYNYITAQRKDSQTGFGAATSDGEGGLNVALDDFGPSYYFRGDVENNYVQFGSYAANTTIEVFDWMYEKTQEVTFAKETPMYWRIVRINGDGTIRMIYDGTEKGINGIGHTSNIGTTAYNTNYNDVKYVGYTYDDGTGKQVDSTIKSVVDTWYNNHLKTNYEEYIADAIFCNDREIAYYFDYDDEISTTVQPSGNYDLYFGGSTRIEDDQVPKLTCKREEDRYTISKTKGNGLLTNPVGLITADEAMMAGYAVYKHNETHYLYDDQLYWTSTPGMWYEDDGHARVWYIWEDDLDNFGYTIDSSNLTVRPVINLKADVSFEGTGEYDSPYIITG